MKTETNLKNPAFVKQSNNPRYWTQTFELEIKKIGKPKQRVPKKPAKKTE